MATLTPAKKRIVREPATPAALDALQRKRSGGDDARCCVAYELIGDIEGADQLDKRVRVVQNVLRTVCQVARDDGNEERPPVEEVLECVALLRTGGAPPLLLFPQIAYGPADRANVPSFTGVGFVARRAAPLNADERFVWFDAGGHRQDHEPAAISLSDGKQRRKRARHLDAQLH